MGGLGVRALKVTMVSARSSPASRGRKTVISFFLVRRPSHWAVGSARW